MTEQRSGTPSQVILDKLFELAETRYVSFWETITFPKLEKFYQEDLKTTLEGWKRTGIFEYEIFEDEEEIKVSLYPCEPQLTNYMMAKMSGLSNKELLHWLKSDALEQKPLKESRVYTASLYLKPDTSDAYLRWENGEQFMYHFRSQTSPHYVFFKHLIDNYGREHTIEQLKEAKIVKPSVKRLHELFTKTFVKGELKNRLAPVCEANRVVLNGSAQFTGQELAQIIRNNMQALVKDQSRHSR